MDDFTEVIALDGGAGETLAVSVLDDQVIVCVVEDEYTGGTIALTREQVAQLVSALKGVLNA